MASRRNPSPGRVRRRALSFLSLVCFGLAMAWGCASTQKGDGSESHFVNCSTDETCAELGLGKCTAGKCERAATSTDGSVATQDSSTADGTQPACSPTDPVPCVMECGHDGYYLGSCVSGVRTCPPNAPFPVDECPFVCGSGLYPPCCGTYGQEPRICPDGAQAICPSGTYETRGPCPDCAVADPKLPVPYPMTFRFTNASGKRVAVWHGCIYDFELTACASGYTVPVVTHTFCSPICPDTSPVTCGSCYDEPTPVGAATPVDQTWDGYVITNEDPTGDRACAQRDAFGPTRYRIRVPVYSDAPPMRPGGGFEKVALYTVSVDFTTSPNGVVEIPIDQGP
jgi:hypothetical protein